MCMHACMYACIRARERVCECIFAFMQTHVCVPGSCCACWLHERLVPACACTHTIVCAGCLYVDVYACRDVFMHLYATCVHVRGLVQLDIAPSAMCAHCVCCMRCCHALMLEGAHRALEDDDDVEGRPAAHSTHA